MSRHVYQCRVRFSDVDVYGHVNNVKYFEYYQEARLALMSSLGREEGDGRFSIVLARIDVDYRRPILFRTEPYAVESWISRVGSSSFDMSAEIKDGDAVLSRADAVLVSFDLATQSARRLTDVERDLLTEALETGAS